MVAKSCWLIEGSPWLVQNKTLKRDFRQRAISATDASSCGDISTPVGAARKPSKSPLFTNSHRWRRVRTWFSTATWSKQLHVTVNIRLSWVSKHQEHRKILSGTLLGRKVNQAWENSAAGTGTDHFTILQFACKAWTSAAEILQKSAKYLINHFTTNSVTIQNRKPDRLNYGFVSRLGHFALPAFFFTLRLLSTPILKILKVLLTHLRQRTHPKNLCHKSTAQLHTSLPVRLYGISRKARESS